MSTRQHLNLCGELANLGRFAIVDAAIVIDHRLAHDGTLDFVECFEHFAFAAAEARRGTFGEFGNDFRLELMQLLATLLLFLDCEGLLDFGTDDFTNRREYFLVEFLWRERALRLAGE